MLFFIFLFCTLPLITLSEPTSTPQQPTKKAIVIGASSGMGHEIAKILLNNGYQVGITARRTEPLEKLKEAYPTQVTVKQMNIANIEESLQKLDSLIKILGGLDLCILAATGYREMEWESHDWKNYLHFLQTDVIAFTALSKSTINFFETQRHGHFVGFSSVSGYRAEGFNSIYSAAKSYATRFLEGERNRLFQKNIPVTITELVPGWVTTSEDQKELKPYMYWVDSAEDAAKAIWRAIQKKRSVGYVTERQEKVVKLIQNIPDDLYNALNARPGGML